MLNATKIVCLSDVKFRRENTIDWLLEKGELIDATILARILGFNEAFYLSQKTFTKCFNPDAATPVEDDIKTFLSVCNAQQKVVCSKPNRKDKLHFVYPLYQCTDGRSTPSATEVVIHLNLNDVVISLAEEKDNFDWL